VSVLLSDIRLYGSANMPEADSATVGGAIDFTKRLEFEGTAISPATAWDVVSSSASDTATKCQIMFRDSTGVIQTPAAVTLNGTTKVALSALTGERLLAGVVSGGAIAGLANPGGTTAVGDVAVISHTLVISAHTMQTGSANATTSAPAIAQLQSGDGASVAVGMVLYTTGGTGPNQIRRILAINPGGLGADVVAVDRNWGTVPDATTTYEVGHGFHFELAGSNGGIALTGTSTQVLAITRMFTTTSADVSGGSNRIYYEKGFINNNNQSTALTGAAIQVLSNTPSLPSGAALDLALCTALNDTNTTTNRQTAPASGAGSFVTQPSPINVPGAGNLPASTAAGNAAGAMGCWFRLTVNAGTAAYEGVADVRATGTST
jgi:hypothetical protein